MYIGTYRLGELVPLLVQTTRVLLINGSSKPIPTEPDEAPIAFISSTMNHIVSKSLPIIDPTGIDYLFGYPLSLDGKFSTGRHTIDITYKISSSVYMKDTETFDIVAGGDASGRGIAMTYFRPHGTEYLLLQTDSGKLLKKKNPRVE